MYLGQSEPIDRITLKVEFNQRGGFVAHLDVNGIHVQIIPPARA